MIPFREIADAAIPYAAPLAERWVGKLEKTTQGWRACCPFHSEKTPSFIIYKHDGHGHCFGCGGRASDLIDLYAKTQNATPAEAARAVARIIGHPWGNASRTDDQGQDSRAG